MRVCGQFLAFSNNSFLGPTDKETRKRCWRCCLLPWSLYPVDARRRGVWEGALLYTDVLPAFAAFFSRAASFFCLFDLGVAFCSFFCFCSLFAMRYILPFKLYKNRSGIGKTLASFLCHWRKTALPRPLVLYQIWTGKVEPKTRSIWHSQALIWPVCANARASSVVTYRVLLRRAQKKSKIVPVLRCIQSLAPL